MEGIRGVIAGVSSSQTNGLLLAMVLIPLVFGFASYVLYQKLYKLDEKTYEDICRQLEKKGQGEA
jgi:Na+/melibiose symporter-like transporter